MRLEKNLFNYKSTLIKNNLKVVAFDCCGGTADVGISLAEEQLFIIAISCSESARS